MEGQNNNTNAIPETFCVDHGSNDINLQLVGNNVVPADASAPDGNPVMDWRDDTIAILNSDLPIRFQDLLGEDAYFAPSHAGVVTVDQGLEETHCEHTVASFQQSLNADENTPASDSSNPNLPMISSGITEYASEEDESREDISADDRHLSRKRKAPEDASEILSEGESSKSDAQNNDGAELQDIAAEENASENLNVSAPTNSPPIVGSSGAGIVVIDVPSSPVTQQTSSVMGSGIEAGEEASENLHQIPNVVGQTEVPHRNIRPRRTINQDDVVPADMSVFSATNSDVISHSQPTENNPLDNMPNSNSSAAAIVHPTESLGNVPDSSQTQPLQLNVESRTGMPTDPVYALHGGNIVAFEETLRLAFNNGPRSFPPARLLLGDPASVQESQDFLNRMGSDPNTWDWSPQGNLPSLLRDRMLEYVRQLWRLAPSMRTRTERRGDGWLRSTRRRHYRRIPEHVLVIDLTEDEPDDPDEHEDTNVDLDDMSYEELLALEEEIGNVCVGLREDVILEHLKLQKYQSVTDEIETCCICQEDLVDGEEMGKLNCGHEFHYDCIKKWIEEKNDCPFCKRKALDV